MAKTYLDILTKRGIDLFLSEENLESLRKFDPRAEYAVPGQAAPVFRSPKQHQIEVGKNSNLIADMCWYGASEAELVRAVRHGMVLLDADKHRLTGNGRLRSMASRSFIRNTAGSTESPG